MSASPPSRVGVYEIQARLGAGGMAEVYRARDTRLGRDVALKILPEEHAADEGRLRRFGAEARAASALNHPNIVAIYDAGSHDALSYIAMELVEGKTLREVLAPGPLAVERFLDLATQLAEGLARAHQAGIVHRDLKPENVMVTRSGLVKILDFGLAKRMPFEGGAASETATLTQEGTLLGTVGYMSPEQAAGQPLDFRSDQFSLGAILYEMATGVRAFQGKSPIETLAAIVGQEAAPIEGLNPRFPLPLRWLVRRCLAKEPAQRYASTEDLVQELRLARERLAELEQATPAPAPPKRRLLAGALAAGAAAALVGVYVLGVRAGGRPVPDFQRLTFGRGHVPSARFAPDGRTVVYGATWEGEPTRVFSTRTDSPESLRLGIADADVAAVSSQGEIAVLLNRPLDVGSWAGTLARAPLAGGAPRELTEDVSAADWSPDGKRIAIARKTAAGYRIELPIGTVLHEGPGYVPRLRFSPKGDRLAFILRGSDRGSDVSVETVDLQKRHRVLSKGWKRGGGLAFRPDGKEVWFSANEFGLRSPLLAVTLEGKQRLLLRLPSLIILQDIAPDGRVLLSLDTLRIAMRALPPGETAERDLTWHDASTAKRLTPDGRTLLFDEGNDSYFHTVYVRPTDGSPAKRLGEGRSMAISPDGRWVVANAVGRGSRVLMLPTGAGEQRELDDHGHRFEDAEFFPDGRRLLLLAKDAGRPDQTFVMELSSGALRPLAAEGVNCTVLSPDGKEAACVERGRQGVIYPTDRGSPRAMPGFVAGDAPLAWSSDGRSLYLQTPPRGSPSRLARTSIFRVDLASGARQLWRQLDVDRAGLMVVQTTLVADGRSYAYSSLNAHSVLYLVTGLR